MMNGQPTQFTVLFQKYDPATHDISRTPFPSLQLRVIGESANQVIEEAKRELLPLESWHCIGVTEVED